jgi:hypothetical protein
MAGGTSGILPDPTNVVTEALETIESTKRTVPLAAFVAGIGEAIPVLDQGKYWRSMVDMLPADQTPAASEVSPSLSQTLLRLHDSGQLRLTYRSDAETIRLRLERDRYEEFTHVEIQQ